MPARVLVLRRRWTSASRFRPVVDRKTDISFAHEILRTVTKTAPVDPAFERAMAEAYPDRLPEYVKDNQTR